MCKCSIYVEKIKNIKNLIFFDVFDIFDIFENITIFSNPGFGGGGFGLSLYPARDSAPDPARHPLSDNF